MTATIERADTMREGLRPAALTDRIRAEYLEMPGLRLTERQAAHLWGLNVSQTHRLLSALVGAGFLMRDARGAYRRPRCPRCS
jgi:DNA-binding IclR family transcriptional regulator